MVRAVTNDGAANVGAGDSITPPTTPSVDFKSMSDEDFAAYEAGRKRYGELASKSKAEAGKKSEAQFVKDYGSYLYSKPMEEFKPSQETAAGFAALGSLMMVAGGLFGGKGRLAGIGAMNNIAGMIKGYQSGRKDLYEQERQQFEENMKVQERNRADIKEAFNLALKMAPTDLRGAEEFMGKVFMSKGMNIPHEMMKTSGLTYTASVVLNAADKADQIQKQVSNQIGAPARATGLLPIDAKLTQQQEIELAKETARRAIRSKEEKGTPENYLITKPDGTKYVDALTPQQKTSLPQGTIAIRAGQEKLPSEQGQLTPAQQELKDIAASLVKQNKPATNEKEKIALDLYAPEGYKPTGPQYGPMAVFERAVPGSSEAFKTDIEKREVQADLQGIGTAANVVKEAQNPNIKFGEVPVLWENIKQKWRSNLGNMGLKDDGTLTFNTVLPTGQTLGDYLQEQIASTPVDPNDQNAVFQKDAAFAQLDIERTGRGGGVLPVGYIKTFGPMLDPKKYTKEAFTGVYQTRLKDLDRKLAGYGFNSDERNKIYTTYGDLIGQPILSIKKSSTAPVAPVSLKDIEFTAQKHGKTIDEVKKILRDAGKKIEGE
jgi:hypothetical protein